MMQLLSCDRALAALHRAIKNTTAVLHIFGVSLNLFDCLACHAEATRTYCLCNESLQ